MKLGNLVVAVMLALMITLGLAAPSEADTVRVHFNMDAKNYAKKIGCKHAYYPRHAGGAKRFHIKNSVVCWLHGKRVNVITFKDYVGQQRWENSIVRLWPLDRNGYWASAHGVVFVSKNARRGAACAGYRAVRGNHDAHAFWTDGWDWGYVNC